MVTGILLIATLLLCIKTISRNKDWQSNLTLFSADVKTTDKSAKVKVYYGKELMKLVKEGDMSSIEKTGYFNEAMQLFHAAAVIDTTWGLPYVEMGQAAVFQNNQRQALAFYIKV